MDIDTLATMFLDNPPSYLIPPEKPVLFPAQQVCLIKNDTVLQENIPNELVFGGKRVIIEHYFTGNFGMIDWCCFNYALPKQKNITTKGRTPNCPIKQNNIRWMKFIISTILAFDHNMWKD